jgi:hypothetical protein
MTGYRTGRSDETPQHRRAGEGLPSSRRHLPNVQRPIRREVLQGCASRLFTPSMAFAVKLAARLLLFPPEGRLITTRQASLNAADRLVAPPKRGFRRWASTRPVSRPTRQPATGPPGSYPDGTHTRWQRRAYVGITYSISTLQLWAHSQSRASARSSSRRKGGPPGVAHREPHRDAHPWRKGGGGVRGQQTSRGIKAETADRPRPDRSRVPRTSKSRDVRPISNGTPR